MKRIFYAAASSVQPLHKAVARAHEVSGHWPKMMGGALKYTELLHKILYGYKSCAILKNSVFMSEKKTYLGGSVS